LPGRLVALFDAQLRAMREGRGAAYLAAMPEFLRREQQNTLRSAGQPAPPAGTLRDGAAIASSFRSRGQLIGFRRDRVMAVLVFRVTEGRQRRYLFLPFYEERGRWRIGLFHLTGSSEPGPPPPPRELKWLTELPTPAALIPTPDLQARLHVMAYGYEVSVTVNGRRQPIRGGKSEDHLLDGGLRRGENTIVLRYRRLAASKDSPASLELRVNAQLDRTSDKLTRVFELKATDAGGTTTRTFTAR